MTRRLATGAVVLLLSAALPAFASAQVGVTIGGR
jgi:hypothetical protein